MFRRSSNLRLCYWSRPRWYSLFRLLAGVLATISVVLVSSHSSCRAIGFCQKQSTLAEGYKTQWRKLKSDIDWVGALIVSTSLAMLAYVLAYVSCSESCPSSAHAYIPRRSLTASIQSIKQPVNIVILTLSLVLVPTFVFWVSRQERLARPSLVPNSIWKNTAFTSTCIMVLFAFATINTLELFSSLFFQQVQHLSAFQASIRFLPSVTVGAILNFTTGMLVHRVSAFYLVIITSLLSLGAPLLMALIQPQWPYWYDAFPAQFLAVLGVDVIFTVGLLIVSEVFPSQTQALAGAVFNTIGAIWQRDRPCHCCSDLINSDTTVKVRE